MKKFIAILFCSIACALQFAHSAVPHGHDAEHHHHGGDHAHHHDHNGDNEGENNSSFAHFFSHFGHSAEVFTSQSIDNVKLAQKAADQPAVIASVTSATQFAFVKRIPQKAVDEPYIYISPHLLSLQFRGPPAI